MPFNFEKLIVIETDPDPYQAYGHGVKKEVECRDFYYCKLDYIGQHENIITKYHHTYATLKTIAINIGPASININLSWGDNTIVEYGFLTVIKG